MTDHVHGFTGVRGLALVIGIAVFAWPDPASAEDLAPFTEEAVDRGLVYLMRDYPQRYGYSGFGCGFVDLDNDGDQDVVLLGGVDATVGLFENDGTGHFFDRSVGSGLPAIPEGSAFAAADYDGDGDLDLYLTQLGRPNILARNDGNLTFTDVTAEAGVGDPGAGKGANWGDFDGDGHLDLYVANYTGILNGPETYNNVLYRNLGDGTFEDVSVAQGVDNDGYGFQAVWFDADLDGDVDLYLSNDRGHINDRPNQLWLNVNGQLVNISETCGAGLGLFSMGLACGDLDGNGYPDLYVTNIPGGGGVDNPLFLNQGNGHFVEASVPAGVSNGINSWGSIFFDFDNTGTLDLYVNNMFESNSLFTNPGTFPCIEIGSPMNVGANPNTSYASAVGDADGDGDLDLLVNNLDSNIELFINHIADARNSGTFRIRGEGANTHAIGARVRVRTGTTWQLREIYAGGNGYLGQNALDVHVGLDQAATIDEVEVTWPGGATQRTFTNLPANALYIIDPTLTADFDLNGTVDILDLLTLLGQWGPCNECQADLDDDDTIGILDLLSLLGQWG